eukprot:TRINITY_DN93387_c0_g1_i1.p1 TRINITY_DN93387_c0_g1~~TRINITY_DN93387_c0_g1_i1.p1  ORF type:complete len:205 (-),score=33.91 TRINITY_DN93387_c0_g1_i1:136-723(-)
MGGVGEIFQATTPGALALLTGIQVPPVPELQQSAAAFASPELALPDLGTRRQAASARRRQREETRSFSFATATGAAGMLASAAAAVAGRARRRRRAARLLASGWKLRLGLATATKGDNDEHACASKEEAVLGVLPNKTAAAVLFSPPGTEALRVVQSDHTSWCELARDAGKDGLIVGQSQQAEGSGSERYVSSAA